MAMTIDDIKRLIASDESRTQELKNKSTYLESWGSGAKRIMDACREQGVEDPTWRWVGGFVIVTFKRPNKRGSSTAQAPTKQDPSSPQVRLKFAPSWEPVGN